MYICSIIKPLKLNIMTYKIIKNLKNETSVLSIENGFVKKVFTGTLEECQQFLEINKI